MQNHDGSWLVDVLHPLYEYETTQERFSDEEIHAWADTLTPRGWRLTRATQLTLPIRGRIDERRYGQVAPGAVLVRAVRMRFDPEDTPAAKKPRRARRPATRGAWYIHDTTGMYWPGVLSWRGRDSARAGRGYASYDEAFERVRAILTAYALRHGRTDGPELEVREWRR